MELVGYITGRHDDDAMNKLISSEKRGESIAIPTTSFSSTGATKACQLISFSSNLTRFLLAPSSFYSLFPCFMGSDRSGIERESERQRAIASVCVAAI